MCLSISIKINKIQSSVNIRNEYLLVTFKPLYMNIYITLAALIMFMCV